MKKNTNFQLKELSVLRKIKCGRMIVFLLFCAIVLGYLPADAKTDYYEGIPLPQGEEDLAKESFPEINAPLSDLPAFPGAEGFGKYVTGGRGGYIYHVTNLNPDGPGSLLQGLIGTPTTPRIIVFDVSGYIDWPRGDGVYGMSIANVTIAGQTAPGDGICIRGDNFYLKRSDNVIIRYLRFRHGQDSAKDDSSFLSNCSNIMIDHCSYSWGSDESFSARWNSNMTLQWSIIADGVRTHSMGGLQEWNSQTTHHCIFANQNDRNPKAKGFTDFSNNVVYNWGEWPYVAGGNSDTYCWGNVVNNYFVAGLDTKDPYNAISRGNGRYSLFAAGNMIDYNKNGILDGISTGMAMISAPDSSTKYQELLNMPDISSCRILTERIPFPETSMDDAKTAYYKVLDFAGASVARDKTDQEFMEAVRNQTGHILLHQDEIGGYCELEGGTVPLDTDQDGMPDEWETAHGLNPNDPEDRNDIAESGYTMVEEYLNELAAPGFPGENYTIPEEEEKEARSYTLELEVNGETVSYPLYQTDRHVMVPLRPVAEYLGFLVSTAEDGQSLILEKPNAKGDLNIDPQPGEHLIQVGVNKYTLGRFSSLNQAPEYKDGMLYVPITAISLQLGGVYSQTPDGVIRVEDAEKYKTWAR